MTTIKTSVHVGDDSVFGKWLKVGVTLASEERVGITEPETARILANALDDLMETLRREFAEAIKNKATT